MGKFWCCTGIDRIPVPSFKLCAAGRWIGYQYMAWLLPAFILPCAGAYRLARFNIDTTQSKGFKGVPIPAAGLLFASFPLIYWYSGDEVIIRLLMNKWFWYAAIFGASYLMVSKLPMLAMKFSGISIRKLLPFLILAVILLVSGLSLHWLAVPITFIAYVILSLSFKQQES
jgi:CDP-diacylglycerol--serine O-phosphatidyltransferase